jgi:hypothetical protein
MTEQERKAQQNSKAAIAAGASAVTGHTVKTTEIGVGGYTPSLIQEIDSNGELVWEDAGKTKPKLVPHYIDFDDNIEEGTVASSAPQPQSDWNKKFYRVRKDGMLFKCRKADVANGKLKGKMRVYVVKVDAASRTAFAVAPDGVSVAKADFWV